MVNNTVTFTTYKSDGTTLSGTPFVFGFTDKSQNNDFDNTGTSTEADLEIPPPPPPGDGAGNPISTSYIDSMYVKVSDGTNDINAYQYFIDSSDNSDISLNLAVRDYTSDNVVFKYDVNDVSGVLGTLNITNENITNGGWTIDLVGASVTGSGGSNPTVTENGDVRTVTLPHLADNNSFYTMNLKQYVADSGPTEVTLNVVKGWNMFGLSANGSLTDTNNLIVSGTIYWFSGTGYGSSISPSSLTANKGYWIKCSNPGTITLTLGVNINTLPNTVELTVVKGWNMFGLSKNGSLTDTNSLIVSGTIYWFSGTGYGSSISPSSLTTNKGYWIKCSNPGTITLNLE